jgi:hypothetical protein
VTLQQALLHPSGRLLPAYVEQTAHWPDNWKALVGRELGIAPVHVHDMGVGGPLLSSFTAHYTMNKAMRMHAESLRLKLGLLPDKPQRTTTEVCGNVEFSLPVELKPWDGDPSHYLLEVNGTVKALSDSDGSDELEIVGELKLFIIKLAESHKNGVPIGFICDCHSSDLDELRSTLFADEELKEEF